MADCYLTERQKDLLRSLAPGLQDGSVEPQWTLLFASWGIIVKPDLPEQLQKSWLKTQLADFDDFVQCGFFRNRGNAEHINSYTLNVQMIIDAVENNFQDKTVTQPKMNQDSAITIIPLFGLPVLTKQFLCDVFMVMPFREPFHTIYSDHIKPLVEALDIEIKLGDNFFSKHEIMTEIWSAIYNSKMLIADCTDKNPNVFYELGIAHTLGRPAIMITQNIDDIPFDVQGKRAIVYEYTPRGMKELETKLKAAIENLLNDGEG